MTKMYIWATILAVTLMTGLLAIYLPTSDAQPSADCPPPEGKFVQIGESDAVEIESYSYNSKDKTFMFSKEVDDKLSERIQEILEKGEKVDIHITVCKQSGENPGTGEPIFKKHTVWFLEAEITDVTESMSDEDDFPKEKVTGKFGKVERMTETIPPRDT